MLTHTDEAGELTDVFRMMMTLDILGVRVHERKKERDLGRRGGRRFRQALVSASSKPALHRLSTIFFYFQ